MRFPRFWQRRTPGDRDELATSQEWRDSELAAEVEAFLTGRLVTSLAARRRPVPPWAVINRTAHADRAELVELVMGVGPDGFGVAASAQPAWEATERFVAGHLLASTGSDDDLWRVQRATLVPLELRLIGQTKVERLTAEQIFERALEALDSFRPGR